MTKRINHNRLRHTASRALRPNISVERDQQKAPEEAQ
jgi:hypothetical protein